MPARDDPAPTTVDEWRRTAQALRRAALAVAHPGGPTLFADLVTELAGCLGVAAAFVAVFKDDTRREMRALAAVLDGRLLEGFAYALAGSPCEQVVGRAFRFAAAGIAHEFARGSPFAEAGIDAYAGYPLNDSAGTPLGLLVAMDRRPMGDGTLAEALLKVFAGRITAEIERSRGDAALHAAALAVSSARGQTVFDELVRYLATILRVEVAFIARHHPDDPQTLQMLAMHYDGQPAAPVSYALRGTPCETVLGQQFRCYSSGLQQRFPEDHDARLQGTHSYAGHPLADLDGRPLGIVAVASRQPMVHVERIESMLQIFSVRAAAEIERLRADEALRRSEASYRAIFDAAEDAVFIHDWDSGAVIDVNPRACELYGYTREELFRADIADISADVPPHTAADARRWIARARSAPVTFEWQRRHKDGSLHWDEVRLKAVTIHGRPHVLAYTREITERKAAEEALRAREAQYRAIFDGSTDAMVLWNRDLRIVDVNRAFTQMYGYARADVVGTTFGQRIPAEGVQRRVAAIRRALQGEEVQLEAETVKKDGVHFEVELRYLPIEHRGEPHVLAVGRDVTERRQALAALRSSEERYRAIFDGSVDSMVLWNRDLEVVDVNAAFVRMTGLSREEVVGRHWTQRPDADDIAQLLPHIEGALQGREVQRIARVLRADGSPFDIELRYLPVRIGDAAHALGVGRDVGERLDRERRLRDSEEQYREIFNATADALVLRDAGFRIIDVNSSYERMSGCSRAEVLGVDRVLANPPEAGAAIRALHRRALAGEPVAIETELVHRDGHRYTLELRGVPTRHRGEPHVLYMGRDISDRRRAERQRSELERQLLQAQKMEAIGQLTGGIAHDFNNILTSVIGYLAMAGERAEAHGDAQLERQIGQATLAAQRARDLIAQMLAFARRQRGERRVLAPGALVHQAVHLLRVTLPSTIELDDGEIDAAVPAVEADAVQLEQVLFNLCINARDAIDGAGRIEVRLGVTELGGDPGADRGGAQCASCRQRIEGGRWIELSVHDTGGGIAPEVLERMFDPFYSTKEVGRGSGMGLAMVHGIVHDHGGHLLVQTQRGAGTRMRVLLPPAKTVAPHADDAAAVSPAATALLQGRVMVVEDEPMVGDFMAELLGGWGLEVLLQRDPRQAAAWVADAARPLELLITDQTMPHLTGLELARQVHAQRPALPIVLYTGNAGALADEDLRQAGVQSVLRKPLTPTELRAALAPLLQRRQTA
jgi:PAS domain S-box-containing protein